MLPASLKSLKNLFAVSSSHILVKSVTPSAGVQPASEDLPYLLNYLPLQGLGTLVIDSCFLPMAQQNCCLWSFILSLWDAGKYLVAHSVWEHPRPICCQPSWMRQLFQECLQQQETGLEEPGCPLDSIQREERMSSHLCSGYPQNMVSWGGRKDMSEKIGKEPGHSPFLFHP